MKKILFGFLFLTILASCKKNYNCSCDVYINDAYQTTSITVINDTKAKAKKGCQDLNKDETLIYGGMTFHSEARCTITD